VKTNLSYTFFKFLLYPTWSLRISLGTWCLVFGWCLCNHFPCNEKILREISCNLTVMFRIVKTSIYLPCFHTGSAVYRRRVLFLKMNRGSLEISSFFKGISKSHPLLFMYTNTGCLIVTWLYFSAMCNCYISFTEALCYHYHLTKALFVVEFCRSSYEHQGSNVFRLVSTDNILCSFNDSRNDSVDTFIERQRGVSEVYPFLSENIFVKLTYIYWPSL
jgi:hypothetical protein